MNVYVALFSLWGLVILALVAILICRSRLTGQETDWIPLTDDKREDQAIQAQIAIEKQVHKLTWPIRVLVILFVVLPLVMVSVWLYSEITGLTV